jgi:uncharacterized membrane protein YhaH (DUF805 family)
MEWYLKVIKENYANFNGRASRKEYWMFTLFQLIFFVVAALVDNILGLRLDDEYYGPFYIIYALATLLPGIAVGIRRLHDIGKSGWWIFIGIIPFIGWIWLIILYSKSGDFGSNIYGEDPNMTYRNAIFPPGNIESSGI